MAARNVARNRQSETGPSGPGAIAELPERFERLLAPLGANSGSVVIDHDVGPVLVLRQADVDATSLPQRVLQEIGDGPPHGSRAHPGVHGLARAACDPARTVIEPLHQVAQEFGQVDVVGRLLPFALCEREVRLDHVLHFIEIGLHAVPVVVVSQELELQAQPRDKRPQVVAHAGQELGPLLDLAPDPVPHRQEFPGDPPDFRRAPDDEWRVRVAAAEALGGPGDGAKRKHLLSQEVHRQHECQDRTHDHQGNEDVGRGTRYVLDRRDDGQDAGGQPDVHLHRVVA